MVQAKVLAGEGDEAVGEFEFDQLPRQGEEISVPGEGDRIVRIFTVGEVIHVAAGIRVDGYGTGPCTVLRYCEEIT